MRRLLILSCTLYVLTVIPSVPSLPSSTYPRHIPGIFTVMCYNVLCDKYATRQMYGYCPSWALEWEYRKKGIMDEIKHYIADIITLQVRRRAEGFVSDSKTLILRCSFDSALYQLLNLKSPFSLAISQYYLPVSLHITLLSFSVFPCHLPLSAFPPTYNFNSLIKRRVLQHLSSQIGPLFWPLTLVCLFVFLKQLPKISKIIGHLFCFVL